MGKQVADVRVGPRRGDGGGSNAEDPLRPTNTLKEEPVWWALDISH